MVPAWTLQELVGPPLVLFLDKKWNVLGHKDGNGGFALDDASLGPVLNEHIGSITGIPTDVLSRHGRALEPVNYADVIARLGWMDLRYTSKIEDRAYCLIGLCDIKSMYLHYGEKGNALPRLLREIRKQYGIQEPLNATRPAHESSPPAMDIDNPPPMTYPAAYLSEAQVAHNSAIATWLEYCRLYSSGLLEVEQVKSWLAHDLLNDGTFMEEARAVVEHRLAYVDTLPLDKRRMRFERAKL